MNSGNPVKEARKVKSDALRSFNFIACLSRTVPGSIPASGDSRQVEGKGGQRKT